MMNGQELATAVQYGLNIIFLVINNNTYGTIQMHQQRHYPNRQVGTALHNPDFSALANAYGALGITVRRADEFDTAFDEALACGRPALIELQTDYY